MSSEFALDLRVQRRKAGYTQRDIAHLLAIKAGRMAALENGRRLPTLEQICALSLIYGRTFESLFGPIMEEAREGLRSRVLTVPADTRTYAGTFNRDRSLEHLARRLAEEEVFSPGSDGRD